MPTKNNKRKLTIVLYFQALHLEKRAPDGGWGWVIVFGSFMISLICDGFSYTTGIFYENFLQVYNETETVTSIFDSIMTGMVFAAGNLPLLMDRKTY